MSRVPLLAEFTVLQKASKTIKRFLTIRIFCDTDTFSDTADDSVVGGCNSSLNLCREVYSNRIFIAGPHSIASLFFFNYPQSNVGDTINLHSLALFMPL